MQPTQALEPNVTIDVPAVTGGLRQAIGRGIIVVASTLALGVVLLQLAKTVGLTETGFVNWRPVALTFVLWSVLLCVGLVMSRGQHGEQAVFLLPAVLLTAAFVIFPTIYALFIAFHDWNLSAAGGRQFNGLDNFRQLLGDNGFRNALRNMSLYVAAVLVQYVIAFGLALLLNQNIRGQRFFRIVFLLPFMLSPVAVSFMIGKSIFDSQNGPLVAMLESIGFENVSFFENPMLARLNIMAMDAWYSIPFVMILMLAGLQAIPPEILEAARIDGASAWDAFRSVVFPLTLPVSVTAVVLRIIFEFKLIDVVRVVTGGGPGSATDTMSLFIYREGIEKTNVGYATALSETYLLMIIVFITFILWVANRWLRTLD